MWMGLGTSASLLLFLVGCPSSPQTASNTAPPAIITHGELERIRSEFHARLRTEGRDEVRGAEELRLIDFRERPDQVHHKLHEVKADLKRVVQRRRNAEIFDERGNEFEFSFRYKDGPIHGHVRGELVRHEHREQHHWDIILRVEERPH
jgi:hypothetical protein